MYNTTNGVGDTNEYKDPLPASDSVFAIEMLDAEGQKTRECASKRGDAEHKGKAELHGMPFVKRGKEEYDAREEAT